MRKSSITLTGEVQESFISIVNLELIEFSGLVVYQNRYRLLDIASMYCDTGMGTVSRCQQYLSAFASDILTK